MGMFVFALLIGFEFLATSRSRRLADGAFGSETRTSEIALAFCCFWFEMIEHFAPAGYPVQVNDFTTFSKNRTSGLIIGA